MPIFENIMLALSGLRSNKMRALLTMLGIIIGISSVITIMTVGNSLNHSITSSMQEIGANNLTVGLKQRTVEEEVTEGGIRFGGGFGREISEEDYITDDMISAYRSMFSEQVEYVAVSESVGNGTAEDGQLYANVSVTGVNNEYLETNKIDLLAGRSLTERDGEEARKVAVVSDKLVESMFEGNVEEAVGKAVDITMGNRFYTYTIVGVYAYEADAVFSSDSDEDVTTSLYLPLKTAKEQTHAEDGYTQLTIVTTTGTDNTSFMEQTESFFNRYYANNEYYEISVTSMESMISTMTDMLSTISIAISIIAGISLLVGGIGVMNIMLVSITERTREIGTRKALGATNGSIRLQFITESIVICLIGGAIGIILGLIMGSVGANILGYEAKASVLSILFSVGFSILIGVFFGYYPANKAANMSPIDALRYE